MSPVPMDKKTMGARREHERCAGSPGLGLHLVSKRFYKIVDSYAAFYKCVDMRGSAGPPGVS